MNFLNEDFTVLWENEETADVKISENCAYITRYTTNPAKQIFSKSKIPLFELGEILKKNFLSMTVF